MNKPNHQPPQWAEHLLRWFCAPHRLDELEDDLDELFRQRVESVGLRRARWRYVRDVLSLMRLFIIQREPNQYPNPNHTDMLRNYLTIAWRSWRKQLGFTTINLLGLSVGLTCFALIALWVEDELGYDRFHQHYGRIARLTQTQPAR